MRDTLRSWCVKADAGAIELAASELIANAVVHAGSSPTIELVVIPDRIRLEVSDSDPSLPSSGGQAPESGTGRGILLVERVSLQWGVKKRSDGKTIWCEFEAQTSGEKADGQSADCRQTAG